MIAGSSTWKIADADQEYPPLRRAGTTTQQRAAAKILQSSVDK
jgi:hypothetical protein